VCNPGKYGKAGRFIALLRGINVGGNAIIKMADLKCAFEASGYTDVRTYIQSGNVVFTGKGTVRSVTKKLETDLSKTFGIELRVVVKTHAELRAVVDNAPRAWKQGKDLRRYVAFARSPGAVDELIATAKPRQGVDRIDKGDGVAYLTTKMSGITQSGFSKLTGTRVYKELTIRNQNAVENLPALLEGK
jgi:uncharacterized protein (DUF1697 family)